MALRILVAALAFTGLVASQPAVAADGLCKPLREFITSVKPDETRVLQFHTCWGCNFRDDDEEVLLAKRCNHGGYEPAKAVCDYLMEHGSTEFAGNNAKSAISCLSTGTRFAPVTGLHAISFSMSFGTNNRGSLVDIVFSEDEDLGGMVLSITADGY